jgi:Predicted phosphohydrolases
MNKTIALLFIGLLLGLTLYVGWRLWRITPGIWTVKAGVLLAFLAWMALFFVSFIRIERLPLGLAQIVYNVGNPWLIFFLYLLLAFLFARLAQICCLLPADFLKSSPEGFCTIVGGVALLMLIGGLHYHHKYREELTITTDKPLDKPLKVVLISDLHLGYHNRRAELARWVDMINAENPDLILTAGDVVDRSIRPVIEGNYAQEFHRLKAPVWTVLGNHDYYSNEPLVEQFFQEAGIRLLRDESAQFGNITVIGRDDRTNPSRKPLSALTDSISGFSILLDHQPYHLEEAEQAGIDFLFSGHTHRGQVWPISWVTDLLYEKSWGHHQRGATRYYITSGIGIWGARIRIGTRSEYLVLNITGTAGRQQ